MPSAEHCLAMADEAERLASIVSYGRDKARLRQQAESWREKALDAGRMAAPAAEPEVRSAHTVLAWLRRSRG